MSRTRDKGAMLAHIRQASQKLNAAIERLLSDIDKEKDLDEALFREGKDAYHEWCKSVDWYLAASRGAATKNP